MHFKIPLIRKAKQFRVILTAVIFCVSSAVLAADLGQLKAQGTVGERLDGYLQLMKPGAPKAVKDLVEKINAQRRAAYLKIAKENNVKLTQVGVLTAPKAMASSPPGTPIQTKDGWVTKK